MSTWGVAPGWDGSGRWPVRGERRSVTGSLMRAHYRAPTAQCHPSLGQRPREGRIPTAQGLKAPGWDGSGRWPVRGERRPMTGSLMRAHYRAPTAQCHPSLGQRPREGRIPTAQGLKAPGWDGSGRWPVRGERRPMTGSLMRAHYRAPTAQCHPSLGQRPRRYNPNGPRAESPRLGWIGPSARERRPVTGSLMRAHYRAPTAQCHPSLGQRPRRYNPNGPRAESPSHFKPSAPRRRRPRESE